VETIMVIDRYPGLQLGSIGPALEQALYALAEDGADEVAGPSGREGGPWAGLLRDGPDIVRSLRENIAAGGLDIDASDIEADDWETLEQAAGVIVMRDETGQVAVQAYRTDEDLAAAWAAILADLEPGEPGSAAVQSPESDDNPT
jgi:hypothetical protein